MVTMPIAYGQNRGRMHGFHHHDGVQHVHPLALCMAKMSYTRGIVVQYQYQGAGIGIVLLVVKNHLYPIPDQYQNSACKEAIRNQEITENIK